MRNKGVSSYPVTWLLGDVFVCVLVLVLVLVLVFLMLPQVWWM
jgi:hypothetical protein